MQSGLPPERKPRSALLIMASMESLHPLDHLIATADRALRAVFAPAHASRPVPEAAPADTGATPAGASVPPTATPAGASSAPATSAPASAAPTTTGAAAALSETERRESAALMRVNHAGEIAAQALYHGQAFVSRSAATRDILLKAAREETDHLAWCETRLKELGSRPSLLNPLWYCGSFAIGVLAAATGDRTSLGFVVETERQVEGHLDEHLTRLPAADRRSRAILSAMRSDEITHGATARAAGASELPAPVRGLMRRVARVMTTAAYWI
jgi:ubiquinone biosynthesis monooxygenase Coq7